MYTVFQKKTAPFLFFYNNFVDPGLIFIIFGSDTPEEIAIKPVLYFPPHLFSEHLLYLVRQASYLTDIHSDEHQNRMVKSGKSQDKKTLTKHAKTSQDSQSKFSKCRPLAFTQVRSRTRHWYGLVDD